MANVDLITIRMIPSKIFSRATDTLVEYRTLGWKWVKTGRPRDCQLYKDFCKAEKEYNNFMDTYYRVFSEEQSEEWNRINQNLNNDESNN